MFGLVTIVLLIILAVYLYFKYVANHSDAFDRLNTANKENIDLNIQEEAVNLETANAEKRQQLEENKTL